MFEPRQDVPLAPRTTFGVGGPARWFAQITDEHDLAPALAWAHERKLPIFILGGGSNLIVSDGGFPGLVLHIATRGIAQIGAGRFTVAAGEDWDGFVAHTVQADCAGIECLSGIPGTCGASPIQNIGAYGQEVAQTITSVRCYDLNTSSTIELSNADCQFSYRTSIFNTSHRGRYIVLDVTFALRPGGEPSIRYADLQRFFAGQPHPTLQRVRDAVRNIRATKGMLLQDGDPDCHSAGSFFKNPVLTMAEYETLLPSLAATGKQCPSFPASDGFVKLSAAWLVEQAGMSRGWGKGRVGISSKHTLALVNRGGATATEVISFAHSVKSAVEKKFGIVLHPEPVMLGFDPTP